MEKNIENNTENKFGNFLNFMKKFLAMSFFCAIAAFGFGALNAQAVITKNVADNYTDVTDKYSTANPKQPISSINETDTDTLKKYTEKEGVLYYVDGDATAYALKRKDPGDIEKPADGKLEISVVITATFISTSTAEKK